MWVLLKIMDFEYIDEKDERNEKNENSVKKGGNENNEKNGGNENNEKNGGNEKTEKNGGNEKNEKNEKKVKGSTKLSFSPEKEKEKIKMEFKKIVDQGSKIANDVPHPLKEKLISHCVEIMKRDDVKTELKNLVKPLVRVIVREIYPYIFFSIFLVIVCFILMLGVFIFIVSYKFPIITSRPFVINTGQIPNPLDRSNKEYKLKRE